MNQVTLVSLAGGSPSKSRRPGCSPKHGPRVPHVLWPFSAAKGASSPHDVRKRERRSGPPAENLSYRLDDSSRSPELAGTLTAPRPWPHVLGQAGLSGPAGRRAARSSVGPAAGLKVRALARGQHPGVLPRLRECPLVAAPVGPRAVPLADVAVEDVLDVLHDEVDGHCGVTRAGSHGRGHTGGASCPPACPPSRHPRGTRFPPQASACHRASAGRPVPAGAGHNKIDLAWWRGFLLTNPGCNTSCQQGPPCQAVLRVFFFPHHLY